jgi:energy-coupling factor transporter ATP-binding protein EcfA2
MKITSLTCVNWLCHRDVSFKFQPMTILAGPNGSGKSAALDGIAFALQSQIARVATKGERDQLITDGADTGNVRIDTDWGFIDRDIQGRKGITKVSIAVPEGIETAAMPYLLNAKMFANHFPAERLDGFLRFMAVTKTGNQLRTILDGRKHPKELLDRLKPFESISQWCVEAQAFAAEERGAWKALTGGAYGAKKAETWTAPVAGVADQAQIEDAEKNVARLKALIAAEQEKLGAAKAHEATSGQRASLESKAKMLEVATTFLSDKRAELAAADAALTTALAHEADVRNRLSDAVPMDCPHCHTMLVLKRDLAGHELAIHMPVENAATNADIHAAHRAAETAREAHASAKAAVLTAQAEVDAAQAASAALAAMSPMTDGGNPVPIRDIEIQIGIYLHDLESSEAWLTDMQAIKRSNDEAEDRTARALKAHQGVMAAIALATDLAPDGLQKTWCAEALAKINKTLRDMATATGWRQVHIGPSMEITSENRPYALHSESEKWRTNAMIASAIAIHTGLRFVLLDEFDILQPSARKGAMGWCRSLVSGEAPQLDSVIIAGTFKEAPQVPKDIGMHWLGEPAAERAAA